MHAIVLLFVVGLALLASDAFVGSFVLAAAGFISLLGSCILIYRDYGLVLAVAGGLVAAALLGLTLYLELVVFPRSRFGRRLVVQSTSGLGAPAPASAAEVVGKTAEALTTLAPSGYVQVESRRYEAFCESGLAAQGDILRVTGVDNFRLIVSKI